MAFFQAKTGRERPRMSEKKNYRSDRCLIDQEQRIPKKIAKKFKKLKNIIMASFQAKTGRERLRKRKFFFSLRSVPTQPGIENSKTIAKN